MESLGDSFSCGWLRCGAQPSLERLADGGLGHSFGSSSGSFIDMDPAELFSMRWTALPPAADFDFGVPGGGEDPPSPILFSASQVIRDGRLLPSEPVARRTTGGVQEHGGDGTPARPPRSSSASSPLYLSAQSTPASLSSCSSARSLAGHGSKSAKPPASSAGKRGGRASSSWRILLRYLRFLIPLHRKLKALRRFTAPRPRVAPGSPARASSSASSSSIESWCHGSADTAVRDAILYCKKSSGQDTIIIT